MKTFIPFLAVLLGFASTTSAEPENPEEEDVLNEYRVHLKADLWKGFREGSWVQRRISRKDADGKERVSEYRITLDRIAENGHCFKVDTLKGVRPGCTRLLLKPVYGDPAAIFETEKKEDIKVGDRIFTCFVSEYSDSTSSSRTHESTAAPGVIVAYQQQTVSDGKTYRMTQRITELDVVHRVGGADVTCWKIERTNDMPQQKTTALFSKDIPGGHVLLETVMELGELKDFVKDEATAFGLGSR